jgi:hypothetical protein
VPVQRIRHIKDNAGMSNIATIDQPTQAPARSPTGDGMLHFHEYLRRDLALHF